MACQRSSDAPTSAPKQMESSSFASMPPMSPSWAPLSSPATVNSTYHSQANYPSADGVHAAFQSPCAGGHPLGFSSVDAWYSNCAYVFAAPPIDAHTQYPYPCNHGHFQAEPTYADYGHYFGQVLNEAEHGFIAPTGEPQTADYQSAASKMYYSVLAAQLRANAPDCYED